MLDKLKIKVSIGGRIYPLTILRKEEEAIRKAAKNINDIIKDFESNYAVKDKQDLLAMCALQLSSRIESSENKKNEDPIEIKQKLSKVEKDLNEIIESSLKN
ncbi:MAG: cell division protein ZapA [Flavobacteriales bacterium TMED288]|nr:cell division protein ZapA [Flavobacteriales bacterium]RPG53358.1 MAG: cell division protein ZapA [Flavobacteriales bacterium TMED288]|tara:strand:+ start:1320 stop:1625 length:306 start_codon:yes stop_codon:yes gene_type:complete